MRKSTERVLVSAHRGGAGAERALEGTREALQTALDLGVDYVELDVRRCGDGTLVVVHDAELSFEGALRRVTSLTYEELAAVTPRLLRFSEALALLGDRAGVHLDLKVRSPARAYATSETPHEVAAVAQAVGALGAERVVVTTGSVRAVRAVRDWADGQRLDLRVGLTLGGSVAGRPLLDQLRERHAQLFPQRRVLESRANALVAHRWLARAGVARFAHRAGLPLLVWTVDDPRALRYWLTPGRAWLVTTNVPATALRIRDGSATG